MREWKIIDMDMKNNFARLKPRESERLIAELFTKMGYQVGLTPKTADFGADIVVTTAVPPQLLKANLALASKISIILRRAGSLSKV